MSQDVAVRRRSRARHQLSGEHVGEGEGGVRKQVPQGSQIRARDAAAARVEPRDGVGEEAVGPRSAAGRHLQQQRGAEDVPGLGHVCEAVHQRGQEYPPLTLHHTRDNGDLK